MRSLQSQPATGSSSAAERREDLGPLDSLDVGRPVALEVAEEAVLRARARPGDEESAADVESLFIRGNATGSAQDVLEEYFRDRPDLTANELRLAAKVVGDESGRLDAKGVEKLLLRTMANGALGRQESSTLAELRQGRLTSEARAVLEDPSWFGPAEHLRSKLRALVESESELRALIGEEGAEWVRERSDAVASPSRLRAIAHALRVLRPLEALLRASSGELDSRADRSLFACLETFDADLDEGVPRDTALGRFVVEACRVLAQSSEAVVVGKALGHGLPVSFALEALNRAPAWMGGAHVEPSLLCCILGDRANDLELVVVDRQKNATSTIPIGWSDANVPVEVPGLGARSGAGSCAAIDGMIYVTGICEQAPGTTVIYTPTARVRALRVATGTWVEAPPLPSASIGAKLFVAAGRLYAVEGDKPNAGGRRETGVHCLIGDRWVQVSTLPDTSLTSTVATSESGDVAIVRRTSFGAPEARATLWNPETGEQRPLPLLRGSFALTPVTSRFDGNRLEVVVQRGVEYALYSMDLSSPSPTWDVTAFPLRTGLIPVLGRDATVYVADGRIQADPLVDATSLLTSRGGRETSSTPSSGSSTADALPNDESVPPSLPPGSLEPNPFELVERLEQSVADMLRRGALKNVEVAQTVRMAQRISQDVPALRSRVRESIRRLLLEGQHRGTSADELRAHFADGHGGSPLEIRLGLVHFSRSEGRTRLPELRALAALFDSDGIRTDDEERMLSRLRTLVGDGGSEAVRQAIDRMLRDVTTASDLASPPYRPGHRVDGTGDLEIWRGENRYAGDGALISVGLGEPVLASPDGLHTRRVHVSGSTVLDTAEGHTPFPEGSRVTTDAFDQVQALWAANHVLERLEAIGVDLDRLQSAERNDGLIRIRANASAEENARYTPSLNEVTTGTSSGEWHTASDMDIVVHELGHYVLHRLAPRLGGPEQAAIHEGFADALAILIFDDPELSEEWGVLRGSEIAVGAPASPDRQYRRNAENSLTLADVSTEPHARGLILASLVWSLKNHLRGLGLPENAAVEAALRVLIEHAGHYGTSAATFETSVTAMIRAAGTGLAASLDPVLVPEIRRFISDEARRRGLFSEAAVPPNGDAPTDAGR